MSNNVKEKQEQPAGKNVSGASATQAGPVRLDKSANRKAATKIVEAAGLKSFADEFNRLTSGEDSVRAEGKGSAADGLIDSVRVDAEDFLRKLPAGTRGVIVTQLGAKVISSNTEIRDSITLAVMFIIDLVNQAQVIANFMQRMMSGGDEKKEEKK